MREDWLYLTLINRDMAYAILIANRYTFLSRLQRGQMKKQNETREMIEKIYSNLKQERTNVALAIKAHSAGDGFTEFDMIRIKESLENAIEVYGEVLGHIEYSD